jgi:hypothetical protein
MHASSWHNVAGHVAAQQAHKPAAIGSRLDISCLCKIGQGIALARQQQQ